MKTKGEQCKKKDCDGELAVLRRYLMTEKTIDGYDKKPAIDLQCQKCGQKFWQFETVCFVGSRKKIEKECLHVHDTWAIPTCRYFQGDRELKYDRIGMDTIIYPCAECKGEFFEEV